jgi:hypothetical protein
MRTNYVLIDYENVQPKDLSLLNGHPFKVMVFVGANQKKIPVDLATALQPLGADAEYVPVSGNGKNALDFHIAFHLGDLAVKDPEGSFHVISKDTGFDPLLQHLKSRGIRALRWCDLKEIPVLGFVQPQTAQERLDAIVKNLTSRGSARPRRIKTLASTINSLFMKKLAQGEIDALIEELRKRGDVIVTDAGKVSYAF